MFQKAGHATHFADGGPVDKALNVVGQQQADPVAVAKQVASMPPARQLSPMGLYSQGAETAAALPQAKGSPQQMKAMLKGVKQEELAGFDDAFGNKKSVTKDEIAQHFQQNMPQVEERVLHSDDNETKFGEYTLPGGENYREVLLKIPNPGDALNARRLEIEKIGAAATPEQRQEWADIMNRLRPNSSDVEGVQKYKNFSEFRSQHWNDPNVLAHLRLADRTGPNGEKILHVEEIQSDWGQKGKKEGFRGHPEKINKVPTAPYVTNTQAWTDLALKRALREAAEDGYDKLVWTPGAEQAKRYSLSNQVDRLQYVKNDDGTYAVIPYKDNRPLHQIERDNIPDKELDALFGRDVAAKMRAYEGDVDGNARSLSGQNLEVGGEGMKGYYDKIVPKRLQELVKKHDPDARVGAHEIPNTGEPLRSKRGDVGEIMNWHPAYTNLSRQEQSAWWNEMTPTHRRRLMDDYEKAQSDDVVGHGIEITPKMRESILKGQPAFKRGGAIPLHPALNIPGVHIRTAEAGEPIFHGEK
jgi:hypothetical protein